MSAPCLGYYQSFRLKASKLTIELHMLSAPLVRTGVKRAAYGATAGHLSRRVGVNAGNLVPSVLNLSRPYSHKPLPHITVFTGTDCQLCQEAKEVLEEIDAPFTMSTYNIHDDSEYKVEYWRRKYQYDIPVLHLRWDEDSTHFGPGESICTNLEIARHRISKEQIEETLAKGPPRSDS